MAGAVPTMLASSEASLLCLALFQARLRSRAESMDIKERQRIVCLPVKEVIAGLGSITIRHCHSMPPVPNAGLPVKVRFCVHGVISPLLANLYLLSFDAVFHGPYG